MITSLALILLVGLALATIAHRLHLPRIIGMLLTGILLGSYVLDLLDPTILSISAELRRMALIIILLKAGIALDISDLKRIGRPAVLMSFLPAAAEIVTFTLLGPRLLGITALEGAILGAVLGAVSPAVVVPRMVQLMEQGYGTGRCIPQLILAGASLDDVFVIVLFTTFTDLAQGSSAGPAALADVPIAIVLGILLGILAGLILSAVFDIAWKRGKHIRNSNKVILLLGTAFLLIAIENHLGGIVSVSGLLAVMSMGCTLKLRMVPPVSARLSAKLGKLWLAAELLLFVLVGAAVDIRYTAQAGGMALLMILISLLFRSVTVCLCLIGTELNRKERLFCVLSYLPKATVQAAIGGVPLSMGMACGPLVLSVAVLSILITAPLGAFAMDLSYRRLLEQEPQR